MSYLVQRSLQHNRNIKRLSKRSIARELRLKDDSFMRRKKKKFLFSCSPHYCIILLNSIDAKVLVMSTFLDKYNCSHEK